MLFTNSLHFSRIVDCRLAAQIANLCQHGPDRFQPTLALSISAPKCTIFFSPKIHVDVIDNKIDDNVKGFYFSIFYEVLAASNAMVADERGVLRFGCALPEP